MAEPLLRCEEERCFAAIAESVATLRERLQAEVSKCEAAEQERAQSMASLEGARSQIASSKAEAVKLQEKICGLRESLEIALEESAELQTRLDQRERALQTASEQGKQAACIMVPTALLLSLCDLVGRACVRVAAIACLLYTSPSPRDS